MVDGLFLGDFFWKVVGTVRIHVSHIQGHSHVEGAFTCGSYSRVEGTFTCGSYSRVVGTFTCGSYSHVVGTFTCGSYSCVVGTFTCGSYSCVVGTFTCGSYSRVEGAFMCWGFLTCGTSHQSEILHSLIFMNFVDEHTIEHAFEAHFIPSLN